MRIFSFIPALAALVTAVAGSALSREDNCGAEAGCQIAQLASKRDFSEHPTRAIHGLTNAALLRRGLPLKNPIMRRGSPVRRHGPSGVPEPGPTKIRHRGYIRVKGPEDNVLGYISPHPLISLYGYQPSTTNALIVYFDTDKTGSGSKLNLIPESSGIPGFGFVGLIQGRDDTDSVLSSGSFHYTYLGGTDETAPGSPPSNVGNSYTTETGLSRTAESAVWTYESGTGALSPQWVNPDGSLPPVQFFTQSGLIYTGADAAAFHSRYPAPVTVITLEFVPI